MNQYVSSTVQVQNVDHNYQLLRHIWEKTCKKLGYPDPTIRAKEGDMPLIPRDYQSLRAQIVDAQDSESSLQEKMFQQGLSGVVMRKRVRVDSTTVVPWMKINFTDLTENKTIYVELQLNLDPPQNGVSAPVQQWKVGKQLRMFPREGQQAHIHRVTNANEIMFLDLSFQNEMSPLYLPVKEQESLGFRIESLIQYKPTSKVFRNYGIERVIDTPVSNLSEQIEAVKARITLMSLTDLKGLATSLNMGEDMNSTNIDTFRKMIRNMCDDPKTFHLVSARIVDGKIQLKELVEQSVNDNLLVFKNGNWYITTDGTDGDVLLRGTSMVDLAGSPEKARERLITIMAGEEGKNPRIDITRELKARIKNRDLAAWVVERGVSVHDTDAQLKIIDILQGAIGDGLIYRDQASGGWFFFSQANQSKKAIVTMAKADGRRPFDVLRDHLFEKGEDWLNKRLEACRLGTLA